MRRAAPIFAGFALAFGVGRETLADPPHKRVDKIEKADKETAAPSKEPTREERIERAKELYAAAEAKFNAGDYAAALAGYRSVNDVMRSPQALFRIAQCIEKVGARSEAEEAYHRFLGLPPPEGMSEEKRIAGERIADLDAGTLKVSSEPRSIRVRIDGKSAASTPIEIRIAPGKHSVSASAPGYEPATREVDVVRGGTMELAILLKAAPAAAAPITSIAPVAAPAAPPAGILHPTMVSAGVLFGLAAASAAVGTIYGVRAISAQSDYNEAPSRDLADKQKTSAIISDGTFGAAIVFAVVGAVFASQANKATETPSAQSARVVLSPFMSSKSQGAAALFRF